jgi:hypothetical protein
MTGMLERAFEIRDAKPANVVRSRVKDVAASLSSMGTMAARCELANEVIGGLLGLCYHTDDDGAWANLDPVTYRIRKPLPWGSRGWKVWGLRRHEADVLRTIMLERQTIVEQANRGYGPLVYDPDERSWFVNVADFPTLDKALGWYAQRQISLREWRTAIQRLHSAYTAGTQKLPKR